MHTIEEHCVDDYFTWVSAIAAWVWVLTLLGCYRFFRPSLKGWTIDLGLISQLWTITSACSEWQVSPLADGNHAYRDKVSSELVHPPAFQNMRGVMTLGVKQRASRDFVVCVCLLIWWLFLLIYCYVFLCLDFMIQNCYPIRNVPEVFMNCCKIMCLLLWIYHSIFLQI
jgi:hypothetical protein